MLRGANKLIAYGKRSRYRIAKSLSPNPPYPTLLKTCVSNQIYSYFWDAAKIIFALVSREFTCDYDTITSVLI